MSTKVIQICDGCGLEQVKPSPGVTGEPIMESFTVEVGRAPIVQFFHVCEECRDYLSDIILSAVAERKAQ